MSLIPEALKERVIGLVFEAEALKGLTGPEKTKWVVDKILPFFDIPLIPAWAERLAVEKVIERVCEWLNWLTGFLYGKVKGFLPEDIADRLDKSKLAAVIEAPIAAIV
jgi:hypothetical protein